MFDVMNNNIYFLRSCACVFLIKHRKKTARILISKMSHFIFYKLDAHFAVNPGPGTDDRS